MNPYLAAREAALELRGLDSEDAASLVMGLHELLESDDVDDLGRIVALTDQAEALLRDRAGEESEQARLAWTKALEGHVDDELVKAARSWREELHPRDPRGRWARKPGARSEDAQLVDYLRQVAELTSSRAPDLRYGSYEELVLARGQAMPPPKEPAPKEMMGPLKECYSNAGRVALDNWGENPRYTYAEGFALPHDIPLPLSHAWLLDNQTGRVVDVTWPDGGAAYRGIEFSAEEVAKQTIDSGVWGMFTPELLKDGEKAVHFREELHPRDWHGRFAHALEGPIKVGQPGNYSPRWTSRQIADSDQAARDALARHPELAEGPQRMAIGYASGDPPEGVPTQIWSDLRGFNDAIINGSTTQYRWGTVVQINDRILPPKPRRPGLLFDLAPGTENAYGTTTHEIGHAWCAKHGVSIRDPHDAEELLRAVKIVPRDLDKVSLYAQSDPREAIAEMYAMRYSSTPAYPRGLPPRLRRKFDRLEEMVNAGSVTLSDPAPAHTGRVSPDSAVWAEVEQAAERNSEANDWVATNPLLDRLAELTGEKAGQWTEQLHPRDWHGRFGRTVGHHARFSHVLGPSHKSHIRRKGYGRPPVMLLVSTSQVDMDSYAAPALGRLLVPRMVSRMADTDAEGIPWACDNDYFAAPDADRYRQMLDRIAELRPAHLQWVSVPDVVGDWKATARQFEEWVPELHRREIPAALVAQDGLESPEGLAWLNKHWDDLDAVFIGGTTHWKVGSAAAKIARLAHEHGKLVHVGRVNSPRRLSTCRDVIGADSADGTSYAALKRLKLQKALDYIDGSPDDWVEPEKPGDVREPPARVSAMARHRKRRRKAAATYSVAFEYLADAVGDAGLSVYRALVLLDEDGNGFRVEGTTAELDRFERLLLEYDPSSEDWLGDGVEQDGAAVWANVKVLPDEPSEKAVWRERLHPRDWRGRFRREGGGADGLDVSVERPVIGLRGEPAGAGARSVTVNGRQHWIEPSHYDEKQRAVVNEALQDALARHPELGHGDLRLRGIGFTSGPPPDRVGTRVWNYIAVLANRRPFAGRTSHYGSYGHRSVVIAINDQIPFGVTSRSSPTTHSLYGMVTHEIGHAYFDKHGISDPGIARFLLFKHRLLPHHLREAQSRYGAGSAQEALAELYTTKFAGERAAREFAEKVGVETSNRYYTLAPDVAKKFDELLADVEGGTVGFDYSSDTGWMSREAWEHVPLPDTLEEQEIDQAAEQNLAADAWVVDWSDELDDLGDDGEKAFREALHPRDWRGRWAHKPGSGLGELPPPPDTAMMPAMTFGLLGPHRVPLRSWRKGNPGKGLVTRDGRVYLWNVADRILPTHDQVIQANRQLKRDEIVGRFEVDPDGSMWMLQGDANVERRVLASNAAFHRPGGRGLPPVPPSREVPTPRLRTPESFVGYLQQLRRRPQRVRDDDAGKSFQQVAEEVHLDMTPPNREIQPDHFGGMYPNAAEREARYRELADANDLSLLRASMRWTQSSAIRDVLADRLNERNPVPEGTPNWQVRSPIMKLDAFTDMYARRDSWDAAMRQGVAEREPGALTNLELARAAAEPDFIGSQASVISRHAEADPSFDPKAWAEQQTAAVRQKLDPATSRIVTRVSSKTLLSVLRGGRFKNQLEARHSSGYYDAETRINLEQNLFGHPSDMDPAERPIYGYVTDDDEPIYRMGGFVNQYGDVSVEFKPEVRDRTTVTGDDSLDSQARVVPVMVPQKIDEADWRMGNVGASEDGVKLTGFADMFPEQKLSESSRYVEAQIHGGLTPDDIAVVHFGTQPDAKITRVLDKAGVKYDVKDEGERRATLNWLTSRYYQERSRAEAATRLAELRAGAPRVDWRGETSKFVYRDMRNPDEKDRAWLTAHPTERSGYRPLTRDEVIAQKEQAVRNYEAEIRRLQAKIDEYGALYREGKLAGFRDVRAMSNPKLRDWYIELSLRDATEEKVAHLLSEAEDAAGLRGRHDFEGQGVTYPAESYAATQKWNDNVRAVAKRIGAAEEVIAKTHLIHKSGRY